MFADKLNLFFLFLTNFMTQSSSYGHQSQSQAFNARVASPRRRECVWTCCRERAWCEGWWRRWEGWWGWWRATVRRTAALLSRGCPAKPPLSVLWGEKQESEGGWTSVPCCQKVSKTSRKRRKHQYFWEPEPSHSSWITQISEILLLHLGNLLLYSQLALTRVP